MSEDLEKLEVFPSQKTSKAGFAIGALLVFIYLGVIALSFFPSKGWLNTLFQQHYVFFFGLPQAALASFVIVSIFETTRGEIQFELSGIKFKGASGPIIMWVLVYLSIVTSFAVVWPLN